MGIATIETVATKNRHIVSVFCYTDFMKNSITVVPAILESDLQQIQNKIKTVTGLVSLVQVDICDGEFVPSKTYGSNGDARSIHAIVNNAHKKNLAVELDMMVNFDCTGCMTRWSKVLAQSRPDRVVFHAGSTYRWDELFSRIRNTTESRDVPFVCGLAVRLDHTRNEIRKILESHDEFQYIQLMGIERVGHSGQKLSPNVFNRIKRLRRAFPDMPIQIDGGVKLSKAEQLVQAGATHLGMNSGLFKTKNIKATINEIQTQNI